MLLYYGADRIVDKPVFGYGNANNDYGIGFYLSDDIDMAKLWASRFAHGGYCITYEVDVNSLNRLYLNDNDNKSILEWITLLIKHRFSKEELNNNKNTIQWLIDNYLVDCNNYDMIIGYRADDSYFAYSRDFVKNELSLETLSQAMKLGKLGLQYVLVSAKAFEHIKMKSYEKVEHSDLYANFRNDTLKQYQIIRHSDDINNTFIRDLMRKGGKQ